MDGAVYDVISDRYGTARHRSGRFNNFDLGCLNSHGSALQEAPPWEDVHSFHGGSDMKIVSRVGSL